MLSIIVCSKNPDINPELENNIRLTIGTEYELVTIDNSKKEFSIFSAYNLGIAKSIYPFICFVHDDVLFRTQNWGTLICRHLRDKNVGVIGVAGGDLVTKVPAPWSVSGIRKNFIQSDNNMSRSSDIHLVHTDEGSIRSEVVLLDGVWLCMRREILGNIRFDEKTFDGFHAYDLDICLQTIQAGYKNYVVYDILIEHFSHGFRNKEWVVNMLKVFNKWKRFLPVSSKEYSKQEIEKIEKKNLYVFVKRMVYLHFTDEEIIGSVPELWKNLYPERSENALRRQIAFMKVLRFFKILGLKTSF
jgi:hypothetical protein